jgi:hypothetical protein
MVWLAASERSRLVPAARSIAPVGERLPPAPSASEPPLMEKLPLRLSAPFKVSVPAPLLVKLPAPDSMPLSPSVLLPRRFNEPPPLTTILLARLKAPLVSSVAVPPTLRLPLPSAPALPSNRPPAFRATPPLNRLAPPSVTTPVFVTASPPVPDSTPLNEKALLPPSVRLPMFSEKLLASDRPAMEAAIAPPLTLKMPLPKAPALSKLTRPSLSVVSALTTAPCRFQVPLLTVRCWKPR